MDQKIQFAKSVIIIDVDFLNEVVEVIRARLVAEHRTSQHAMDWVEWLSYLALDGGLKQDSGEIQVLLLQGEGVEEVKCCHPSRLAE